INRLFSSQGFIKKVKGIAYKIFKAKDERQQILFEDAKDVFTHTQTQEAETGDNILFNIDKLLKRDENGNYKLEWDLTINIYKPTDIPITRSILSNLISNNKLHFFIVDGNRKTLQELSDTQVKNAWILVADDDGKIGLALANKVSLDLPADTYQKIKIGNNFIEGVFITDRSGNIVKGPMFLDHVNNDFKYQKDYKVANSIQETINNVPQRFYGTHLDKMYTFNYLRSLTWKTGSKITPFIQGVQSNVVPTGAHESLISVESATKSLKVKKGESYYEGLLYNYDYDKLSKSQKSLVDFQNKKFIKNIYFATDLILDTKQSPAYLPVSDLTYEWLGSYENFNGEIINGPDSNDLTHILGRIIPNFNTLDYTNPDNIIYKIFSIDFVKNAPFDVRGTIFRGPEQKRKQWFQDILTLLQGYTPPTSSPPSTNLQDIDNNLNRVIVDLFNNFKDESGNNLEFDFTYHDRYFSTDDLQLAYKVSSALSLIFKRFISFQMYTGGMMVKDGTPQVIRRPWGSQYDTLQELDYSSPIRYGRGFINFPTRFVTQSSWNLIEQFTLDRFTQASAFILPTDPSDNIVSGFLDLHPKYKTINFEALPTRLWQPNMNYPKLNSFIEKSGAAMYLSNLLFQQKQGIQADFENWKHEGKELTLNMLLPKLKSTYSNDYEQKHAIKALRSSIYSSNLETASPNDFRT
ncbi:hypothetical protein LCGC14_2081650, partial [marine sediment metagenome]